LENQGFLKVKLRRVRRTKRGDSSRLMKKSPKVQIIFVKNGATHYDFANALGCFFSNIAFIARKT